MKTSGALSIVILFVFGLALSDTAFATEAGCDSVDWKPQILAGFAGIDQACQEVVDRDGKRYAHFQVKVVKMLSAGKVRVRMRMNDGSWVERMFFAPKDFEVLSASGRTTFDIREMRAGDILDVYIPESRIIEAKVGEAA